MTEQTAKQFAFEPGADMESMIFQAIGAASMCWSNPSGAGEFQSERAEAIGVALLARVRTYLVGEVRLAPANSRDEFDW